MALKILAEKCRFTVPFYYSEKFDKCLESIEAGGKWERRRLKDTSNLLSYVPESLGLTANENEAELKTGAFFSAKGKPDKKEYEFKAKNSGGEVGCVFTVSDRGLIVFSSGIGFFWYELEIFKTDGYQRSPVTDPEEMIIINYYLKELSYGEPNVKMSETVRDQLRVDTEKLPFDTEECARAHFEKTAKEYGAEVSFGGITHYTDATRSCKVWKTEARIKRAVCISDAIVGTVREAVPDAEFFAKHQRENGTFKLDKALIFNYIAFDGGARPGEEDIRELERLSYYFSSGYKQSYRIGDVSDKMIKPFYNVRMFTTEAGSGYYCVADGDNRQFFETNMYDRGVTEYFLMYILLLFQKYAVIRYNVAVQHTLPQTADAYLAEGADKEEAKKLAGTVSRLVTEINLFIAKSVWGSVSSIPQHNEYYLYSYDRLGVETDIDKLKWGLEQLREISEQTKSQIRDEQEKERDEQEKERDNRRDRGLAWIAALAVFSALIDSYQFFSAAFDWLFCPEWIRRVLEFGSLAAIAFFIFMAVRAFKGKGGKKKK